MTMVFSLLCPGWVQIIVMTVNVCVYLHAYLRNHTSELHQIFAVVACECDHGRSSYGGIVICYVFPVLWITPCFHTMGPMVRHMY